MIRKIVKRFVILGFLVGIATGCAMVDSDDDRPGALTDDDQIRMDFKRGGE